MPIAPLLQRFVDDELARTPQLIEQARVAAQTQLQRAGATESIPASDVPVRREAAQALQRQGARFTAQFVDDLRALVLADLRAQDGLAPASAGAGAGAGIDALALMDESRVESEIEISRAAMLIDSAVEWEQRELQTFTSALRGEAHVGTDSNPLRPALVARALWQATGALALPPPHRLQVLRTAAASLGSLLKLAYAAAASRLEAQGVEPSAYRTVLLAPGSVADGGLGAAHRAVGDGAPPSALRELLGRMPGAPAGAPGAEPTRAEQALARLGASARRSGSAPASAIDTASTLGASATSRPAAEGAALTAPMRRDAPREVDPRAIDLVSRLFDTLLADPALPASARRAVARLQEPTRRIALHDASLLDAPEHPAWRLIDRIANACQQAELAGAARLATLAPACERLADDIANHATPDAALCRQGLARLDALLAEQLRQAQQAAQGAIAALQRTDGRMRVQTQVQARLEEQFVRSPVGAATRRYLLGPWAQGLAEAIQRAGPDGEATAALTRGVDDLLWSLHPPAHPASRVRLVKLLPGLLERLRAGMTQHGLGPSEQQAVLDELEASHSATLWPKGGSAAAGAPTPAETPEDIVRRLREEVFDEAPPRRDFGDSVLDLSMLDTVPAGLLPEHSAADDRAGRALAAVTALAPGVALRLLLQGHWIAAELLWRSEGGELLLFADAAGATHALTRRALERLHAEGLARFDPPGSAVRRAVMGLLSSPSLP